MITYSVYRITNLVNDKKYIGWTSRDPTKRYKEHSSGWKNSNQDPSLISLAVEKYGKDNFTFEVLYQSFDYEHSREYETHFIKENNSLSYTLGGWGYNIDLGGLGHKRSKETVDKWKQKMSGRKKSEIHKQKISDANKGENNAMYGITGELHPNYGKILSEDVKLKISETKKKQFADGKIPPRLGKELTEEQKQNIRDGIRKARELKQINNQQPSDLL